MMSSDQALGILFQIYQSLLVVLLAPLLTGWVNQCRAWLQNTRMNGSTKCGAGCPI